MGFRSSLVVCVTSFLLGELGVISASTPLIPVLGSLFTHWTADSLTLWKSPVTDEHLWTAASYYSILANGPAELYYVLAVIVGIGAITILLSLRDGEAGNLMFDGGSICKSNPLSVVRRLTPTNSPVRYHHFHVSVFSCPRYAPVVYSRLMRST